jgi:hypothetical protein
MESGTLISSINPVAATLFYLLWITPEVAAIEANTRPEHWKPAKKPGTR